jgi:dipeptidyl-peptidase-4
MSTRCLVVSRASRLLLVTGLLLGLPVTVGAQTHDAGFTIEQILSPAFPYGLVGARRADRVAWLEAERGMRNVFTAAAPDYKRTRLTATIEDDALDLNGTQISDDGSVVIFVRGHPENFKGQFGNQGADPLGGRRDVWAASTSGGRPAWRVVGLKPVAPVVRVFGVVGGGGGQQNREPRLSPDGEWVAYIEDGQVHTAAVDPGNADAATVDATPPLFSTLGENSSPVWSPDSRKIAFVTARYDQRQYFPTQGQSPTHSFVAVYDMDSRRITYLAPSVDRDTNPTWSADGRQIAFLRRPGLPFGHFATAPLRSITREQVPAGFLEARFEGGYTLSLMVADVATGDGKEVWHSKPGADVFAGMSGLQWVGDRVVFQTNVNSWFSLPLNNASAEPALLTPGEGELTDAQVSPDGRYLYFTSGAGDVDRRHMWRVAIAGGQPQQITQGQMIETALVIPGSGANVVALQSGPRQPVTPALFAATGGQGRLIGAPLPAEFPAAKHVVPTSVEITAADGVKSRMVMFLPADLKAGEKRPTLLYNHGGGGRSVLGYPDQNNGYYHITYAHIQYFVNKGYIVGAINYRGDPLYSPDFNDAKEFGAEGVSEYRDVLAAGKYLASRPDVDAERLGVWGLSYGGWLSGEALSRNSDLFKAGAIHAGVMHRSTSIDPENLGYQSSPSFNIDKWTSPTLIIHGDDDRSVEFSQTIGLVHLLRARGITHKVIVFPDETHYFMRFKLWYDEFKAIDDWFEQNLIKKRTTTTSDEQRDNR